MVQRVATVAFEGIEARAVGVQVQVAPGLPAFTIVGLPDKAVSEAKEHVRSALIASGLALPATASPSISPPPICRKKKVITICRSRSDLWQRSAHRAGWRRDQAHPER
jgi:Subunit ChlI of Mg-chelatase